MRQDVGLRRTGCRGKLGTKSTVKLVQARHQVAAGAMRAVTRCGRTVIQRPEVYRVHPPGNCKLEGLSQTHQGPVNRGTPCGCSLPTTSPTTR